MTFISISLPLSDIVCSCKALTAAFLEYMLDFWPQHSTFTRANKGKAPGISLIWPAFHKVKWLWACPCVWGVGSFWAQVPVLNKQDYLSWEAVVIKAGLFSSLMHNPRSGEAYILNSIIIKQCTCCWLVPHAHLATAISAGSLLNTFLWDKMAN